MNIQYMKKKLYRNCNISISFIDSTASIFHRRRIITLSHLPNDLNLSLLPLPLLALSLSPIQISESDTVREIVSLR